MPPEICSYENSPWRTEFWRGRGDITTDAIGLNGKSRTITMNLFRYSTVACLGILLGTIACNSISQTTVSPPTPTLALRTNTQVAISTFTPEQKATNTPSVTPVPVIADPNPFRLTVAQLAQLGNPTEPFAAKRQVVVQRFERGVMLIFAQAGNVFDQRGGDFIFALANDGRAWRIKDTFIETSKNSDDWYTCERKPGLRPERSGIPWRGFGKAWCDNPPVRDALGLAKIYEDVDDNASFQSYERGRAFQVSDWKGYPGWKSGQVYVVLYSSLANPDLVPGKWE